jgi:hypothetical protein
MASHAPMDRPVTARPVPPIPEGREDTGRPWTALRT